MEDKIVIVGEHLVGKTVATEIALSKIKDFAIISPEVERGITINKPEPTMFKAPIQFDMPFQPPLTRAQRRKKQRQNNKKLK